MHIGIQLLRQTIGRVQQTSRGAFVTIFFLRSHQTVYSKLSIFAWLVCCPINPKLELPSSPVGHKKRDGLFCGKNAFGLENLSSRHFDGHLRISRFKSLVVMEFPVFCQIQFSTPKT